MPTASRQVRKIRRIKRERTQAFRALAQLNYNFEALRAYAQGLRQELDKVEAPAVKPPTPAVSITRLPEDEDNSE